MKKQRLNDLHISHYIKQPENLKLLILAGTEVQKSEFQTIRKCLNLIKLDLSNNGLKHIPIPLQDFPALKIIYLHDNNFETFDSINVKGCHAEYITLFNNPIKHYRRYLLNHLKSLKAIDKNVVSAKEACGHDEVKSFLSCTEIKWPLVEVDKELENENDYLNLLKGELLVLNDGYFKTYNIEKIESYLRSILEINSIQAQLQAIENASKHKQNLVKRAAQKWKTYTIKRRKLRAYLIREGKQHLIANRIEYRKYLRSDEANRVIQNYVNYIRTLVTAKKMLRRGISQYSQMTKTRILLEKYEQSPFVFYVKQSQWEIFNKIFLYIKKILFNKKKYELCEDFEKEVKRTGKKYIILRTKPNVKRRSTMMEKVSQAMNTLFIEDYTEKRSTLYNKKGHIHIIYSPCEETQFSEEQNLKLLVTDQKLSNLYNKYDALSEWSTKNSEIYFLMNKLTRFYNSGNSSKILKNTTAYFQTQVPDEEEETPKPQHEKLYIFLPDLIKRAVSATKIQCFWKRTLSRKKFDIIKTINKSRASKKIQRWYRSLKFLHRNRFIQDFFFYEKSLSSNTYYIQLFIYMNLPSLTNTLNFDLTQPSRFLPYQNLKSFNDLYEVIHKNTRIKTLNINEQSWVKIEFSSVHEATKRLKLLRVLSYRLPYASSIKLFKIEECAEDNSFYQENISNVYSINIDTKYVKIKNKPIDNPNSLFIYEKKSLEFLLKTFLIKPKITELKISMFITNQGKKALKMETDLAIFSINNLYLQTNTSSTLNSSLFGPGDTSYKQAPRYSVPQIMERLSNTKKLMPLKEIRPYREQSWRKGGQSSRHKTRSMAKSKEESMLSLGSLKLISETMPFKKR